MKKFTKNTIALLMIFVLVLSPMKVFAAELPTEAVYDLEKGGTQTFVIQDENGEVATVTVEELSGNARIADGNYKVGYDNTVWQASFKVSISNNQIYNVYDPYHYALRGEIRYPALSRPSTTHVIYGFIYVLNAINYVTGIDAKITNGEMVITKR